MHSVESLFKCAMNLDSNTLRVPHDVELQFVTHPEMILSCLEYFEGISDNKIQLKKKQIYLLFNEGFTRLRYKLDNQDTHAKNILDQLHQMLKQMFQSLSGDKKLLINDALHESKLPTPELDYNEAIESAALDKIPNISPQLPAFLDLMRREGGIKTSFELYAFLMSYARIWCMEK